MSWLWFLRPRIKNIVKVPFGTVKAELEELGIEYMLKDKYVADLKIYYTDEGNWQKVIPWVSHYVYYQSQTPEVPDCDDAAKRASVEAAFKFHLHCLTVWGDSPYGRHAYSLVKIGEKLYRIFEPNKAFKEAGRLMKLGENGYGPDSWRI